MDIYIRPELRYMNNPECIYTSWNKTFLSLFGRSKNGHKLYDGVKKHLLLYRKTADQLTEGSDPKMPCVFSNEKQNGIAST